MPSFGNFRYCFTLCCLLFTRNTLWLLVLLHVAEIFEVIIWHFVTFLCIAVYYMPANLNLQLNEILSWWHSWYLWFSTHTHTCCNDAVYHCYTLVHLHYNRHKYMCVFVIGLCYVRLFFRQPLRLSYKSKIVNWLLLYYQ